MSAVFIASGEVGEKVKGKESKKPVHYASVNICFKLHQFDQLKMTQLKMIVFRREFA